MVYFLLMKEDLVYSLVAPTKFLNSLEVLVVGRAIIEIKLHRVFSSSYII